MRPAQIEAWALDVVERATKLQPIEDTRVEVKATWVEPAVAARRIAGLVNAARGESTLWVVGVDEKAGTVPGVDAKDLATWWRQVAAQFDGLPPTPTELAVPVPDGKTIVAILFLGDRAPCVVRNPNYGKPGGGNIEREVPWREGTAVRSATRADLLRLLVPAISLPSVELLKAEVRHQRVGRSTARSTAKTFWIEWYLRMELYLEPVDRQRVVIPVHRCSGSAQLGRLPESTLGIVSFGLKQPVEGLLISAGGSAVLEIPGVLKVDARMDSTPDGSESEGGEGRVTLSLGVANAQRPIVIEFPLRRVPDDSTSDAAWEYPG